MNWIDVFRLKLTNSKKRTGASIIFEIESMLISEIIIHLVRSGYGIEHEINEIDIIETVLKIHPDIVDFDWYRCRSVFHQISKGKTI